MRVRHSVRVDLPVSACTPTLVSGPQKWFPRLNAKKVGVVGTTIAGIHLRKRVVVDIGESVSTTW